MEKEIEMYRGYVEGVRISDMAMQHGYLDYASLAKIVGPMILHNTIREATFGDWEMVTGIFDHVIMNDFLISAEGYEFLAEYTDEVVFYNPKLNLYIWAVDHTGTRWDHVLTNTRLKETDKNV